MNDKEHRSNGPGTSLRWGIVGTGQIAGAMAPRIAEADGAELAAVCSRNMSTARAFAGEHGVSEAFDSWEAMVASSAIDAVYIATPTFIREAIAVASAGNGKHVLAEKPFDGLASVRRIAAACRENGVGFMDGTHFPHLERTQRVKAAMKDLVGTPWSVASDFVFDLSDRNDIRYQPRLEPYGAIGDAGWYNMRAAVEYLPDDIELVSSEAWLQRDDETSAVVTGSGVMRFSDGSSSTWNCGFLAPTVIQELRIIGRDGVVWVDDFVGLRGPERFRWCRGEDMQETVLSSDKHAAALMFEDFSKMVRDPVAFEASVRASERTQAWLDAAWESALANEA